MGYTTTGKNNVRDHLGGQSPDSPSHIALGTDSTAFNDDDVTLAAESTRISIDTQTLTNKKIEFAATLNSAQGNGITFKEVGLFSAASAGDMFQRAVFNGIDKDANIEIKFIITLRVK